MAEGEGTEVVAATSNAADTQEVTEKTTLKSDNAEAQPSKPDDVQPGDDEEEDPEDVDAVSCGELPSAWPPKPAIECLLVTNAGRCIRCFDATCSNLRQ